MKPIFSTMDYCLARLKHERSASQFPFTRPHLHSAWKRKFKNALWRQFGMMPSQVPLRARVTERKDCGDYIREKVVYQTERWMWVPAWVLIPKKSPFRSKDGKLPSLLAMHGHGRGKDDVIGLVKKDRAETLRRYNYDYALQAVRRGYLAIAHDSRSLGERKDPDEWVRRAYRDGCNVADLATIYFGVHLLGLNVWDGLRTVDYLLTRKEVDRRRMGSMGLSFGGTMTAYMMAFDSRLKAGCISGYASTLGHAMGEGNANFCGSQTMPGLALHGDIPDAILLSAPRPLCLEIGSNENVFHFPDMKKAAAHIRRGYRSLGVEDRLCVDIFPGKHEFSGRKSWDFFEKWLA